MFPIVTGVIMFMVALLSLKVRHPKSKKKAALIFFKFYIVHHYLECVIWWRADRDAAFSFCGVSSVEMVSCIATLILTAPHLGYSSAYAIFKCRLLIKGKLRPCPR